MPAFTTGQSSLGADGVLYCKGFLVQGAEGDLFNGQGQAPVAIPYHEAVSAEVFLTVQGVLLSNTTYILLQTDFGDGNWFDVAWSTWTGIAGNAFFYLSAGVAGSNSFQQSRAVGAAPSPVNGSNQCCLGGRIRFAGKSTFTGGVVSSSSGMPGITNGVLATIRYRLLGLR
jgi:hypothetical protein